MGEQQPAIRTTYLRTIVSCVMLMYVAMLAEAENEANQGLAALAYTCINEVRKRAGIDEVKDLSYGDFQKLIRDEMRS